MVEIIIKATGEKMLRQYFLKSLLASVLITEYFCGCATVRKNPPITIEQSTPHLLLKSFHHAAQEKNYSVLLECMEPSYQKEMDCFLVVAKNFWSRVPKLIALIEEKIGEKQSKETLNNIELVFGLDPLRGICSRGKVSWEKIAFVRNKNTVAIFIDGNSGLEMVNIKEKWFLSAKGYSPLCNPIIGTMYKEGINTLDRLKSDIQQGRITKDNWELGLKELKANY
jgi:hypothetical protein